MRCDSVRSGGELSMLLSHLVVVQPWSLVTSHPPHTRSLGDNMLSYYQLNVTKGMQF